ncbi:hypothetical protein AXW84_10850 [Hymenobacter sp. PAMC 26628]|nr:hypothetical protein AXW84_10850 [Hymenobacter sp. PAMC 26628]
MELISFLLCYWEFYTFEIIYLLVSVWAYRAISRRKFISTKRLLLTGIAFWILFLMGFCSVAIAALVLIMFTHAEKVL